LNVQRFDPVEGDPAGDFAANLQAMLSPIVKLLGVK